VLSQLVNGVAGIEQHACPTINKAGWGAVKVDAFQSTVDFLLGAVISHDSTF
jgi:hypothetical protein